MTDTVERSVEQLDLATIVEISQKLSGEIVVEKLIDRFMRAAIEQSGAKRAVLVAVRDAELRTSAEAVVHGNAVTVQVRQHPAHDPVALPDSIIRHVVGSHDTVLLDDAKSQNTYSADPYIVAHHVRSALSLPLINQGRLIAILYLENNETPNVFTSGRVTVLKVLASQAAISLENAGAARALKQSETRYQNLFQAMAVSFFELDYTGSRQILRALKEKGIQDFRKHLKENPRLVREIMRATRVVDVNDQAVASFGRGSKAELLTSVEAFWPEESLDDYAESVLATIERNDNFTTETRVRKLDGTIFEAQFTLRYANEEKTRGLAGVIDITERKRAENALRVSEERFRDYAETASDWLWETGPDHKLTQLTANAFGSSPSARLGTAAWERALDIETEPEKWRAIRATMDSRKPFRDFVYRAPGGDGSPMYVRASGKPVFASNGEFRGYRGTGTDVTEIIRAQEAVLESERNTRLIVDSIPGLVGILDANGDIEAVNRQILEYYGKTLEELKKHWPDLVHPPDLPRVIDVLTRSIASGEPFEVEFRARRFDGVYRWLQNRGFPLRDVNNRVVRWYNLLIDIDERKRAEEALRESEQSLRSVIDGIPGLIAVAAPNGELEAVNRQVLEYFGRYSAEELRNWGTLDIVHPEDLPRVLEIFQKSIVAGLPFHYETRLRRFDGEYRWFDARFVPVRDGSDRIVLWYVLLIDIQDRKRAEEALRESEQRSRSVIDGIPGLVLVTAPNGELETVNRQVLEYFGRSAEEIKKWGTTDIIHPEDLPRILEIFKNSIAAGNPFHYETRGRRYDGEYRWFDARFVPIRDDAGHIVRWYVLLTDIEDRTHAQARLQQMQADFARMNRVSMMGELAASLSHEITQPIASARNNARAALNFLDKPSPDFREAKEALGCVVGDADRAGEIIARMRDQIRKAPPRKDHFDLNAAIVEVIALARSALIRSGVAVQTRLADQMTSIHGDRVQLQQVLLNLILNAVEAMGSVAKGARELSISTEHDRTGILVVVRDSGPGINPKQLGRIFEAFYTTKPGGTGLGLSICRSIIDAHGGRLWAEANEFGGATFRFTLPGAQAAP